MKKPYYRKMLDYFNKIMLLFLSIFFALIIVEGIIRYGFPVYNPAGMFKYYKNSEGVPLGPPNFKGHHWKNTGDFDVVVEINKYGFRDKKDLINCKENNIVVVGDSFAFGYGVPEERRFSNILQERIGIPIYNIAIPGSIYDYNLLVNYSRHRGAIVRQLVVGVCIENDLLDYDNLVFETQFKGNWISLMLSHFKHLMKTKLATYNMIASLAHHNPIVKQALISSGLAVEEFAGMSTNEYDEGVLRGSLNQLKILTKGTSAVILIIPSRGNWVGNNITTENKVHAKIIQLLKENGFNVVDMKPIFEQSGKPLQYHFKLDGHWNELGHLKAAEALAAYFQKVNALH